MVHTDLMSLFDSASDHGVPNVQWKTRPRHSTQCNPKHDNQKSDGVKVCDDLHSTCKRGHFEFCSRSQMSTHTMMLKYRARHVSKHMAHPSCSHAHEQQTSDCSDDFC